MTIEEQIEEFYQWYGDKLPNPEHEPLRFAYYVRMYQHTKSLMENNNGNV
jgi:hypothetical protein